MSGIYGLFSRSSKRAEFVNLAEVRITCVPQRWIQDLFPGLAEIPWAEDVE